MPPINLEFLSGFSSFMSTLLLGYILQSFNSQEYIVGSSQFHQLGPDMVYRESHLFYNHMISDNSIWERQYRKSEIVL